MNTKTLLTRTTIVFAGLAIAGIITAVSSQFVMDSLERTIMVTLGSAIFGAALCFFLVRVFALMDK
jgi:hypothetical protein